MLADTGFNEAAIFRSRKPLLWLLSRARHPASMRPRSFDRGNATILGCPTVAHSASMRPRSFDRGNVVLSADTCRAGPRFNEAAIFRSRKPSNPVRVRPCTSCFNEAAIFRSRKRAFLGVAVLTQIRFNEAAIFRSRKQRTVQLFYFQRPSGVFASGVDAQSSEGVIRPLGSGAPC